MSKVLIKALSAMLPVILVLALASCGKKGPPTLKNQLDNNSHEKTIQYKEPDKEQEEGRQ